MTDHIDTAAEREKLAGLTGFTPGPWEVDSESHGDEWGWSHSVVQSGNWLNDISANVLHELDARLIAAAPDLLATVHRLLDALDAKDAEIEIMAAANTAAIARSRDDLTASFLCGRTEGREEIRRLLDALDAERARAEKAEAMLDHTQQWYAERVRKIEDVAKRAGIWPEIAAILANGTASRQMPDGSFSYDPPTYAQQLNIAKHRAQKAEAERDQALASAAAAYELAAEVYWDGFPAWDTFSAAREAIRALTPADAQDALDKMLDAAWNEAVEASAFSFENNTPPRKTRQTILALKRPEASHE